MLLINPVAGRAVSRIALGTVVDTFCSAGWTPTVYFTSGPRSGIEITAQRGAQYDRLVCMGGDGTLSDTIAGLMRIAPEKRPLLGYIPMGTANDMATNLHLARRRPLEATRDILAGQPVAFDVGSMGEGLYFTYVAAFGAFTEVSYQTDQDLKHALGQAAYLLEGLSQLPHLKSYRARVEYDGGVLEDELVFGAVSNSTSVAGMIRLDNQMVALSDGKFELTLIRRPTSLADVSSIINGFLNQDYRGPTMTIVQTSRARFSFEEPVAWTRDGEDGGLHSEIQISNLPRAVQIIL